MAEERTLPVPAGHREIQVEVDGDLVPRQFPLAAMHVVKAVNKISWARLIYHDGSPAAGDFPLSNTGIFVPGRQVEVFAGAVDQPISIFQGMVLSQALRIRQSGAPQLIVECRHRAVKLTVGRRDASFFDRSDSEILAGLLDEAELPNEVESTSTSHPQQVLFRSTPWDFLLARAEANGKLVFTNDDKVVVKAPRFGGRPAFTVLYGATLLELDAEIDARSQLAAVRATTWSPADQALVEKDAADPGYEGPGNFSPGELAKAAGPAVFELHHGAMAEAEAQSWADSRQLLARLSKVSGRAKCEGIATVNPGDLVRLAGVGERFTGEVYVTGVRQVHDLAEGFKTHLQFGGIEPRSGEARPFSALPAGGLLAAVPGLQIGVVAGNEDPEGEHRVRVRLPVSHDGDGLWARVASPDAGAGRGFFFRPEVGDEVVVGFLEGDPRQAILLGMLHSSAKPAPLEASDDNPEKAYQSRSGLRLYFDDDKKLVSLETPAGNRLALNEEEKAITLEDQHGNKIVLDQDGIRLESGAAISVKAQTELALEAGTTLEAKGGSELKLAAQGPAELVSQATLTVRGSLVKIN